MIFGFPYIVGETTFLRADIHIIHGLPGKINKQVVRELEVSAYDLCISCGLH